MSSKKSKEHDKKKPPKTDRQKKAEAEMMKTLTAQYNGTVTPEDLRGMKDVFDNYDTNGQGIIKTSQFGKILRLLGLNPLESDIQRITKEVDPQNLDQMKFPQYVAAFLSVPSTVTDNDILPAFQVFDTEKRGVIEGDEILKSLTNVGETLNEAEAKAFRDNLNMNDLGLFDYSEFFLKFTQPAKPKGKKKGKKKKKKSK